MLQAFSSLVVHLAQALTTLTPAPYGTTNQQAPMSPVVIVSKFEVVLHASQAEGVQLVTPIDDRGHWHRAVPGADDREQEETRSTPRHGVRSVRTPVVPGRK